MTAARLMLAGGSGRLVRRPSTALFDPTGENADLAAGFDSAASDREALDSIKKHLVDSGFTAAPLVVVSWDRQQLHLLIFGDVALHTTAMAAPMVSGAGSASWVERHIGEIERGSDSSVELWSGEAADPTTNLGLGVVASAGFRLSLEFATGPVSPQAPAPTNAAEPQSRGVDLGDAAAADVPAEPPAVVSASAASSVAEVPRSGVGSPDAARPDVASEMVAQAPAPQASAPQAPAPQASAPQAPAPQAPAPQAPAPQVSEPQAPAAQVPRIEQDATVGDDEAAAEAHAAAAHAGAGAPDATVGDDEAAATDPFAGQAGESERVGLIEAAHCQQGHPNPPRSAACYRCGISLIDDQSLSLIDQPTVGRLLFPGGQSVVLDRDLELGRKPAPPQHVHPVIIDHAEVSRSHASLKVEGWTVLLTDLDSRNGTWIVPPNDVTPVRLDPQVSHVLEHGTRVHIGGPEVAFTYLFDAEE